jgi:hypothetical protein
MYKDEVNCMLPLDMFLTDELRSLEPHHSTLSMAAPREISGNLSMPKPVIASISHWIGSQDDIPSPEKLNKMKALQIDSFDHQ